MRKKNPPKKSDRVDNFRLLFSFESVRVILSGYDVASLLHRPCIFVTSFFDFILTGNTTLEPDRGRDSISREFPRRQSVSDEKFITAHFDRRISFLTFPHFFNRNPQNFFHLI